VATRIAAIDRAPQNTRHKDLPQTKKTHTFRSSSKHSLLYWFCSSVCCTCTPFSPSTLFFTAIGSASMYPELRPTSPANFPCTIPSIADCTPAAPRDVNSSAASPSSEMSGTVGRERPDEIGACCAGVFWGVGAVMPDAEMGTEELIVCVRCESRRIKASKQIFGAELGGV
jgi:hypothetical protein